MYKTFIFLYFVQIKEGTATAGNDFLMNPSSLLQFDPGILLDQSFFVCFSDLALDEKTFPKLYKLYIQINKYGEKETGNLVWNQFFTKYD